MVVLENLQRAKISILTSKLPILLIPPDEWPGTDKISFLKNTLLDKSRVLHSKCPGHFAWGGLEKGD
jgi:hypothetical protein